MLAKILVAGVMAVTLLLQGCTTSGGTAAERGDRCAQLAKDIDRMKGKPQRRSAASDQFDAECRK